MSARPQILQSSDPSAAVAEWRGAPGLAVLIGLLATLLPGDLTAQGQGANGLRRGDWRPQDVPKGYAVADIGKYHLQSDCDPVVVQRVGKQLNAMFRIYSRLFPASKTPKGEMVVKLFKNRQGFLDYGAPPGAGGYFSPTDKEMVGFNTGKVGGTSTQAGVTGGAEESSFARRWRDRFMMDTIGVFNHEGWHQYFHWSCGSQIPFPAWADEGIGEYFYPSYAEGGEMVLGAPNDYRLATIQSAVRRGKHVPLEELVRYEQAEYYRNPGLCYAEGWSFVHFLFEHPHYAKDRFVTRFVKIFRDEHSIAKTNKQVFGRLKWSDVEEDWKKWVLAIPPAPDSDDEFEIESYSADASKKVYDTLPADVQRALDGVIAKRRGFAAAQAAKDAAAGAETPAAAKDQPPGDSK